MKPNSFFLAALLFFATLTWRAQASTYHFIFDGGGISGSVTLTYGTSTDGIYPNAYEVKGISGVFSDTNLGISNASITGLQPLNYAVPESSNLLAPADFSKFAVAKGLPPENNGYISYDNLFWPGGSPQTASDYPFHGGFVDIYGLLFGIGHGEFVNFWSNGVLPSDPTSINYGAAVITHRDALDYAGGISPTPEPGSFLLLGTGLLAVLFWRRSLIPGLKS